MGQITFLLGIHNHQPVGNFEWVFEEAMKSCYGPFLEVLSQHPKIRLSLHHTGPLFEWIEQNKPQYLQQLKKLVDQGQVELLGGAFYEPLISTLPRRDAIGQIQKMSDYLLKNFGQKPRGMWLAERVWEPQLASIIHQAGLEYTLLDDTHFYYAGLQEESMFGYYVTEDEGKTLSIFPISKHLRYLIPFNTPENAIEYFGKASTQYEGKGITLGDDGEKFGLWPGTYHWVYEEKYLDRLLSLLEQNDSWLKTSTYSDYMDNFRPNGRIYLPNASYEEMMEWSLPTKAQKNYESVVHEFKNANRYESLKPFLRGGFWRNFFSKYPESNLMHKKMTYVSHLIEKMPEESSEKKLAQQELWKGQCNCPYWHGLFGGLYLNYLRHANYSHLIEAENIAFKVLNKSQNLLCEKTDYNCDGQDEILVTTPALNAYFQPGYGGSISEIDYRYKQFNLTNVLSRREESYHEKIAKAQKEQQQKAGDQPKSIHDLNTAKEEGLENLLFYDWYTRHSLLDHLIKPGTSWEDFYRCQYREEGDFVDQPYEETIQEKKDGLEISLRREGHLYRDGLSPQSITIEKNISFKKKTPQSFLCHYQVTSNNPQALEMWLGIEFNLTLLDGNNKKRHYLFNSKQVPSAVLLNSKGEVTPGQSVSLVNAEDQFKIHLSSNPQAQQLWHFPLETISQSESGFERTYQGSCLLFLYKIQLPANQKFETELEFQVSDL